MEVFILMLVFKVHGGGISSFQEFSSKERCEAAKAIVVAEEDRLTLGFGLRTAVCLRK